MKFHQLNLAKIIEFNYLYLYFFWSIKIINNKNKSIKVINNKNRSIKVIYNKLFNIIVIFKFVSIYIYN